MDTFILMRPVKVKPHEFKEVKSSQFHTKLEAQRQNQGYSGYPNNKTDEISMRENTSRQAITNSRNQKKKKVKEPDSNSFYFSDDEESDRKKYNQDFKITNYKKLGLSNDIKNKNQSPKVHPDEESTTHLSKSDNKDKVSDKNGWEMPN